MSSNDNNTTSTQPHRIVQPSKRTVSVESACHKLWNKARTRTGLCITPQRLREWFCCEMVSNGVSDCYVDAFCGRIPRSVLAKHYLDYSPEKLKEIYDKANLKVVDY